MKQINLLEVQDFKDIAIRVKRAFYLKQPLNISREIIDGECSLNIDVNHSMYALGNEDPRHTIIEFMHYYELTDIIHEEEVTLDMIPLQVFSYGEYFGDIEDEVNYHNDIMGLSVEQLAVTFYNDYIRVVRNILDEVGIK